MTKSPLEEALYWAERPGSHPSSWILAKEIHRLRAELAKAEAALEESQRLRHGNKECADGLLKVCDDLEKSLEQAKDEYKRVAWKFRDKAQEALTPDPGYLNRLKAAAIKECLKDVDAEEELPGRMPDEMWQKIKGDRGAIEESHRMSVRLTKRGIRERLEARAAALSQEKP